MSKPSFLRHSGDITPESLTHTLNIIGCGAVGSHVALQAARMGWRKFRVWDFDVVEDYNLPNQAYMPCDIGSYKVDALERILKEFNPEIQVEKYDAFKSEIHKLLLEGAVVLATDSIATRRDITNAFAFNSNVTNVVEARLGFDYGEVHRVDPLDYDSIKTWRNTLTRSDDEIPDGPCNLRICPTLVGLVANTIVHLLCLPYASQRGGMATVPFMTRFMMKDILYVRTYKLEDLKEKEVEQLETTLA